MTGEPLAGSPGQQVMVDSVGAELLVSDSGGQGIPIVFLSGGPGMPDYLSDVADLVEGRRVVAYDQRGTGGSRVRPATAAFLGGIGRRATFATRAAAIRLPADHLDGVLPEAVLPFVIVFGQDDIYANTRGS